MRVGVAGATGYIGMQCAALLHRHPAFDLRQMSARSTAGRCFSAVVPGSDIELEIREDLDPDSLDVVVAALPHGVAATRAEAWRAAGAVVVDLSADFRLQDPEAYARWYGTPHPAPQLCKEAVYGLVEVNRDALKDTDILAMPGCYPTATLLALAPALQMQLVETTGIVVDAKSGISGAGRSPSMGTHFSELNESVQAYSIDRHRHKSELVDQAERFAKGPVQMTFVPHLIPMTRGILATAYLRPRSAVQHDDLDLAYRDFATSNPFLRWSSSTPSTKSVSGRNVAAMNLTWQDDVAVVTVAIDNLVKGAAGQAVQAMNIRFGFDERTGLDGLPSWP